MACRVFVRLLLVALVWVAVPGWPMAEPPASQPGEGRWQSAIAADDLKTLLRLLDAAPDSVSARELVALRAGNGKSLLMVAAKLGAAAVFDRALELRAVVDERTLTGGSAFMFAVLGDQRQIAQQLLKLGADINAVGSNGWSALMIAAARGKHAMAKWLIAQGANVDRADVYGLTPLMRAVDNGHEPAARVLLEQGMADVMHTDESGSTALHYAVAASSSGMVSLLLRYGADPAALNRDGISPLSLAEQQDMLKLLR